MGLLSGDLLQIPSRGVVQWVFNSDFFPRCGSVGSSFNQIENWDFERFNRHSNLCVSAVCLIGVFDLGVRFPLPIFA